MDLSIVVVNWNTRQHLARCLRHVYETVGDLSFEVFVVDNASQDRSASMVRSSFPQVRLIENAENVGFARANNSAIERSQGRYILLLNPDAFVGERAIEEMVGFMDEHPEAGAAGCRLRYPDGAFQLSCASFPSLRSEAYRLFWLYKFVPRGPAMGHYGMTYDDLSDVREVDVLLGAFMLVRRQTIEDIGPLNERFFMYSEEVDWCYRMREAGWRIYYVPLVEAVHVGGASTDQVKAEMVLELYKSRIAFFRQHDGALKVLLYKLLLVGASIPRLALLPFGNLMGEETRRSARTLWSGYWRLLRALPRL